MARSYFSLLLSLAIAFLHSATALATKPTPPIEIDIAAPTRAEGASATTTIYVRFLADIDAPD